MASDFKETHDRNSDQEMGRGESRFSSRNEGRFGSSSSTKGDPDRLPEYKDPSSLYRFISDGGKITPARITKSSIAQQKRVSEAVKRARSLALLPIGMQAADEFFRPELISPSPFSFE